MYVVVLDDLGIVISIYDMIVNLIVWLGLIRLGWMDGELRGDMDGVKVVGWGFLYFGYNVGRYKMIVDWL